MRFGGRFHDDDDHDREQKLAPPVEPDDFVRVYVRIKPDLDSLTKKGDDNGNDATDNNASSSSMFPKEIGKEEEEEEAAKGEGENLSWVVDGNGTTLAIRNDDEETLQEQKDGNKNRSSKAATENETDDDDDNNNNNGSDDSSSCASSPSKPSEVPSENDTQNAPQQPQRWTFDGVFDGQTSQEQVNNTVKDGLVAQLLEGYDCTVVAYGGKETGKSYTILGGDGDGPDDENNNDDGDVSHKQDASKTTNNNRNNKGGIAVRLAEDLFHEIQQGSPLRKNSHGMPTEGGSGTIVSASTIVRLSVVEIYLERIIDLLHPTGTSAIKPIELKTSSPSPSSPSTEFQNCTAFSCVSAEDVAKCLRRAAALRTAACRPDTHLGAGASNIATDDDNSYSDSSILSDISESAKKRHPPDSSPTQGVRDSLRSTVVVQISVEQHLIRFPGATSDEVGEEGNDSYHNQSTYGNGAQHTQLQSEIRRSQLKLVDLCASDVAALDPPPNDVYRSGASSTPVAWGMHALQQRILQRQLMSSSDDPSSPAPALCRLLEKAWRHGSAVRVVATLPAKPPIDAKASTTLLPVPAAWRNFPLLSPLRHAFLTDQEPASSRVAEQIQEAWQIRQDRMSTLVYKLAFECQRLFRIKSHGGVASIGKYRNLWDAIDAISVLEHENRPLQFTVATKKEHEMRAETFRIRSEQRHAEQEKEQVMNTVRQLRSDLTIVHSERQELQQENMRLQEKLRAAQNRVGVLEQEKNDAIHNLRTSQFRESEAAVFLRQFRRFYMRLLRQTAMDGSGKTTDEVMSQIPGAPDLHQLVDIDHMMVESGLIEKHEVGRDDLPGHTYRPSREALALSRSAADAVVNEQKKEQDGYLDGDDREPPAEATVVHLEENNWASSIVSRKESGEATEARQRAYKTPAGRYIAMREKMLDEELLKLSEKFIGLQSQVEYANAKVEMLITRMGGAESADEKTKSAKEIQHLKDLLDRKGQDVKAFIWKMNELHMVGQTIQGKVENREQHVTHLEKELLDWRRKNSKLAVHREVTERKLQSEVTDLRQRVNSLITPIWQLSDSEAKPPPLGSRLVVPLSTSATNGELTVPPPLYRRLSLGESEEWMDKEFNLHGKELMDVEIQTDLTGTDTQSVLAMKSRAAQTKVKDAPPKVTTFERTFSVAKKDLVAEQTEVNHAEEVATASTAATTKATTVAVHAPAKEIEPSESSAVEETHVEKVQAKEEPSESESADEGYDEDQSESAVSVSQYMFMDDTTKTSRLSPVPGRRPSVYGGLVDAYDNASKDAKEETIDKSLAPAALSALETPGKDPPWKAHQKISNSENSNWSRSAPARNTSGLFQVPSAKADDDADGVPEWMKKFKKIAAKNINESVIETSGAVPPREATRVLEVKDDHSDSSPKTWSPKKKKGDDDDDDDEGIGAFAMGAMSTAAAPANVSFLGGSGDDDSHSSIEDSANEKGEEHRASKKKSNDSDSDSDSDDDSDNEDKRPEKASEPPQQEPESPKEDSEALSKDDQATIEEESFDRAKLNIMFATKAANAKPLVPENRYATSYTSTQYLVPKKKDDSDSDDDSSEKSFTKDGRDANSSSAPPPPPIPASKKNAESDRDSSDDDSDDEKSKPVPKAPTPPPPPAPAYKKNADCDNDSSDEDSDDEKKSAVPQTPVETHVKPLVATKKNAIGEDDDSSNASESSDADPVLPPAPTLHDDSEGSEDPSEAPPKPASPGPPPKKKKSFLDDSDSDDSSDEESKAPPPPKPKPEPPKPKPEPVATKKSSLDDSSVDSDDSSHIQENSVEKPSRKDSDDDSSDGSKPKNKSLPPAVPRKAPPSKDSEEDSSDESEPKARVPPPKPTPSKYSNEDSSLDEPEPKSKAKKPAPPKPDSDDEDSSDEEESKNRVAATNSAPADDDDGDSDASSVDETPAAPAPAPPPSKKSAFDRDTDDDSDDSDDVRLRKSTASKEPDGFGAPGGFAPFGGDDAFRSSTTSAALSDPFPVVDASDPDPFFDGGKPADFEPNRGVPDFGAEVTPAAPISSAKSKKKKDKGSGEKSQFLIVGGKLVKSNSESSGHGKKKDTSIADSIFSVTKGPGATGGGKKKKAKFVIKDGKLVKDDSALGTSMHSTKSEKERPKRRNSLDSVAPEIENDGREDRAMELTKPGRRTSILGMMPAPRAVKTTKPAATPSFSIKGGRIVKSEAPPTQPAFSIIGGKLVKSSEVDKKKKKKKDGKSKKKKKAGF